MLKMISIAFGALVCAGCATNGTVCAEELAFGCYAHRAIGPLAHTRKIFVT